MEQCRTPKSDPRRAILMGMMSETLISSKEPGVEGRLLQEAIENVACFRKFKANSFYILRSWLAERTWRIEQRSNDPRGQWDIMARSRCFMVRRIRFSTHRSKRHAQERRVKAMWSQHALRSTEEGDTTPHDSVSVRMTTLTS